VRFLSYLRRRRSVFCTEGIPQREARDDSAARSGIIRGRLGDEQSVKGHLSRAGDVGQVGAGIMRQYGSRDGASEVYASCRWTTPVPRRSDRTHLTQRSPSQPRRFRLRPAFTSVSDISARLTSDGSS
jgi:hypothetical protein